MRKAQKRQAENFIKLLGQAHEEIKRFIEKREISAAMMLLSQCQEGAIGLGNLIEKTEGEGFLTVTFLEDYCELVYQTFEQLAGKQEINANKLHKKLQKALLQIENSVRNDIKVQLETVFFPYKASMWDSMESVWRAAEADPNCNAYVVPIPYYDRLSDGTFGQMHDEKDMYPDDIPVADWKTYDVGSRHPDIIFIHSPYDAGNYVTSIHPNFYSKHLKKNTDLLVYIPYFISFGALPEEMCVTAGSFYADKVILQSEAIRQMYIQAFKKFEKNHPCTYRLGKIDQKFQALGSPKYDKAIRSKQNDFCLPNQWENMLYDPENRKRKVIFYNTSLGAILKGGERYLKKICSVLETFKKRKDVLLWWRPHPLSKETFHSMRPQFLEKYEQIVQIYQQEKWGIYDDTPDLHRAVSWCDAYYGDISSVIELFLTVKKPVMLQCIEDYPISFENIVRAKDYDWVTAFNFNGLFRLNGKTGSADFMGCFPNEKDGFRLFFDIVRYQNMLIFTPFSAEGIAVYRMDTEEYVHIPLKKPERINKQVTYLEQSKFCVCVVYEEYAFLFPCTYPAIVKFNLKTMETEYLYETIAELDRIVKHKDSYYFRKGKIEGKYVKLWCAAAGAMVEFDMESCRFNICFQLKQKEMYIDAAYGNSYNWLLPGGKSRTILKVSKDYRELQPVVLEEEIVSESLPFLEYAALEDELYLFPGTAKKVIKIKENHDEIEEVRMFDGEHMEDYQGLPTDWRYFLAKKSGDKLLVFNNFAHQLITYDMESGQVQNESIMVNQKSRMNRKRFLMAWKAHFTGSGQETDLAVYEDCRMVLDVFLDTFVKEEEELLGDFYKIWNKTMGKDSRRMNGTCGCSIYEYAKKCLQEAQEL